MLQASLVYIYLQQEEGEPGFAFPEGCPEGRKRAKEKSMFEAFLLVRQEILCETS